MGGVVTMESGSSVAGRRTTRIMWSVCTTSCLPYVERAHLRQPLHRVFGQDGVRPLTSEVRWRPSLAREYVRYLTGGTKSLENRGDLTALTPSTGGQMNRATKGTPEVPRTRLAT